jgi:diacylglycerol kinase family enzyme
VAAARRLVSAPRRRISLGLANGRRFGFAAGYGLDAEIVRRVDRLGRRPDGRRAGNVAFAWTAVRALAERGFRLPSELELEGHGPVTFVLAANADPYTYAGPVPLHVAPRARFEAGVDVVAPRRLRRRDVPRFALYAARGRGQEQAADVVYLHDIDGVEAWSATPAPLHVDGEDLGDVLRVAFGVERGAVTVIA